MMYKQNCGPLGRTVNMYKIQECIQQIYKTVITQLLHTYEHDVTHDQQAVRTVLVASNDVTLKS